MGIEHGQGACAWRIEGEIHWHLACPKQYSETPCSTSRVAADCAERALADRGGCVAAGAGDIHDQHRLGKNGSGRPGTAVVFGMSC